MNRILVIDDDEQHPAVLISARDMATVLVSQGKVSNVCILYLTERRSFLDDKKLSFVCDGGANHADRVINTRVRERIVYSTEDEVTIPNVPNGDGLICIATRTRDFALIAQKSDKSLLHRCEWSGCILDLQLTGGQHAAMLGPVIMERMPVIIVTAYPDAANNLNIGCPVVKKEDNNYILTSLQTEVQAWVSAGDRRGLLYSYLASNGVVDRLGHCLDDKTSKAKFDEFWRQVLELRCDDVFLRRLTRLGMESVEAKLMRECFANMLRLSTKAERERYVNDNVRSNCSRRGAHERTLLSMFRVYYDDICDCSRAGWKLIGNDIDKNHATYIWGLWPAVEDLLVSIAQESPTRGIDWLRPGDGRLPERILLSTIRLDGEEVIKRAKNKGPGKKLKDGGFGRLLIFLSGYFDVLAGASPGGEWVLLGRNGAVTQTGSGIEAFLGKSAAGATIRKDMLYGGQVFVLMEPGVCNVK